MLPIDPSTYSFDPIFMNGIIGMLVQKMKATKHPLLMWISESTPGIARAVNVVLAAFSASLMALTYTTADDGSIAVTVSGITFQSVCTFLWTVAKNFGAQSVAGVSAPGGEPVEGSLFNTDITFDPAIPSVPVPLVPSGVGDPQPGGDAVDDLSMVAVPDSVEPSDRGTVYNTPSVAEQDEIEHPITR
jgi:hypothetical protein